MLKESDWSKLQTDLF